MVDGVKNGYHAAVGAVLMPASSPASSPGRDSNERAPFCSSALLRGKPIIIKENGEDQRAAKRTLMVPIKLLNQVIGVIEVEQENPDQLWTEEDIAMVQAAANRAALTLENARLLEESQRRAVKERAIFEATSRIGAALNIENILYMTAEEIERVTNSTEVILQFTNNKKA